MNLDEGSKFLLKKGTLVVSEGITYSVKKDVFATLDENVEVRGDDPVPELPDGSKFLYGIYTRDDEFGHSSLYYQCKTLEGAIDQIMVELWDRPEKEDANPNWVPKDGNIEIDREGKLNDDDGLFARLYCPMDGVTDIRRVFQP